MFSKNRFILIFVVVYLLNFIRCKPAANEDPQMMCKLPRSRGMCRALIPRWSYNQETKTCEEFSYGGCLGNANNFRTEKECLASCGNI